MRARHASNNPKPTTGVLLRTTRLLGMLLPVVLLLLGSSRVDAENQPILWLGAAVQLLFFAIAAWTSHGGREAAGPSYIMLYAAGLVWLVAGGGGREDALLNLAQAILLVVPLVFFALQCLRDSGATSIRQARLIAARLMNRTHWPDNLMEIRQMPEVEELREALHVDAAPALEMLTNPKPAVRVAALAALEFRPSWRPGQAQLILQLARRAAGPEVRACAVNALGNVEERPILESLAELLTDPSPLVRHTTTEALLWNVEDRWPWLRDSVHLALGDPVGQNDGPLRFGGNVLTRDALSDLYAWCTEKGIVSVRAALTLGVHYARLLSAGVTPEVLKSIRDQLRHPQTPPMLRLELARLMRHSRELNPEDLQLLLDSGMPAPVRLIAVELLLKDGHSAEAMAALHDLARLPNREIALATADVVQRYLGIDLGLPRDQPMPSVESRTAAEVARRVLHWALQYEFAEAATKEPTPVDSQPIYHRVSEEDASSRVDLA